jgi:4-diphosphocytidyl-2-C-methyl-D-erythritol kinase
LSASAASQQQTAVVRAAPAKINLYLHVVGLRADGYHLLDSLVAFAECGDVLRVAPSDELTLAVDGPFAAALAGEGDNLVLRAARALAAKLGRAPAASIRLTKNLPVASGIGGGSADAAATLQALEALWGQHLSAGERSALALTLGADVPVCCAGHAAYMGGVGEQIDAAPHLPPVGLVLVNPGLKLATVEVFKARTGAFSAPARFSQAPRDAADLASLLRARTNDLAAPAARLCPAIPEALAALEVSPGCRLARLSGSGATCFGVYDDQQAAARAAAALSRARPGWWITATRLAV